MTQTWEEREKQIKAARRRIEERKRLRDKKKKQRALDRANKIRKR